MEMNKTTAQHKKTKFKNQFFSEEQYTEHTEKTSPTIIETIGSRDKGYNAKQRISDHQLQWPIPKRYVFFFVGVSSSSKRR